MTRYSPKTGLPTTYQVGPFDSSHLYIQWGGVLPGAEQWSCGIRMAWQGTGANDTLSSSDIAAYVAAIKAFHGNGQASISPRAQLTEVKVNVIATTGHYANPNNPNTTVFAPVNGGGTDSLTPPNQVAWCVSLRTAQLRGPGSKGRFYVPLPTVPIGTDGEVSASLRDPLNTAVGTFLTALNAVEANWQAAIFSRKSGAPGHNLITSHSVGRVLDTVRRRRRSLKENY